MTQHILEEDTEEDARIMKRLAKVIGGFFLATVLLALSVGLIMG
ncbi:hypothetical protein [Pseudohalioglobus lutimaris]|nr:hypothetical protein [Pseudohalioglobus lutimaris]